MTSSVGGLEVAETLSKYDVLITGTTGFVGMAMLEKLIWLHNEITNGSIRRMKRKIYLLLRKSRKYSNIETRLVKDILQNVIFDEYNRDDLLFLIENKCIIPIEGDITGMSNVSEHLLENILQSESQFILLVNIENTKHKTHN